MWFAIGILAAILSALCIVSACAFYAMWRKYYENQKFVKEQLDAINKLCYDRDSHSL